MCSEVRPGAALAYVKGVPGFVVLGLARNRYCENIGRHHKGNRILIIVQLCVPVPPNAALVSARNASRGDDVRSTLCDTPDVRNACAPGVTFPAGLWWQKCQDPDCRAVNFRSEKRAVPLEILQSIPGWTEEAATYKAVERARVAQAEQTLADHAQMTDDDMQRVLGASSSGGGDDDEEDEGMYTGLHEDGEDLKEVTVLSSY